MIVEAGDIFFTRSPSLLGRLIRWASCAPGEEETWANHTGLFVQSGPFRSADVVEALWRVRRGPLGPGPEVEVYRYRTLTRQEAQRIVEYAKRQVGSRYGWWKLLFHLADRAFFKGDKKVSSLLRLERRPICSFLVAMAYSKAGIHFDGFRPEAADPDEMHDFVKANPTRWRLVGKEKL